MQTKAVPYHREALERELLERALELLKRGGAEALSLRELGRAAQVSRTAPYHYFEDKAALLQRLGANGFAQLSAVIRKSAERSQDAGGRLKLGLRAYYEFAQSERNLFNLMFANVLARPLKPKAGQPPFAFSSPEAIAAYALILEGVHDWLATRPKDKRDPNVVANIFWAYTHGVAVLALDHNVKHGDPALILNAGLDALMA